MSHLPPIKDLDSKEAYLYQSIRNQTLAEMMNLPDIALDAIERSKP